MKKCLHCNKQIKCGRTDKKYCSGNCRMAHWLKYNHTRKLRVDRLYSHKHKEKIRKRSNKYYYTNKKHCLKISRSCEDKRNIDDHREEVYKRDDYKCTECGISMKTHKRKTDIRLYVTHIDGENPRKTKSVDSSVTNLTTLCQKCHFKKYNSWHRLD